MAKKCPGCGKMIANAAKVCPICGNSSQNTVNGSPTLNHNENAHKQSMPSANNINGMIPGFPSTNNNPIPTSIPAINDTNNNNTSNVQVPPSIPVNPQNYNPQSNPNNWSGMQIPISPPVISGGNSGLKELFFIYNGRLNRKPFILRYLGLAILQIILLNVVYGVVGDDTTGSILGFVFTLPFAVAAFMLVIRRWHDLDKSGYWVILCLIPLVNIIALICLFFKRGTVGPNQYGPDPIV